MIRSHAETVYFIIVIVLFALIFITLIAWLYTAYTKMDEMLKHLSNCEYIKARKVLLGIGPISRLFMMGAISGVILSPNTCLKYGQADPEDIKSFPGPLKRRIAIQYHTLQLLVISMLLLWSIGKYMDWLK